MQSGYINIHFINNKSLDVIIIALFSAYKSRALESIWRVLESEEEKSVGRFVVSVILFAVVILLFLHPLVLIIICGLIEA